MKLQLDWVSLPESFNWTNNKPNPQLDVAIATVFRQRYAVRVIPLYLWEAQCKAVVQLCKVANIDQVTLPSG